ncbi:MAG: type II toxin-antitoxin system HicB family antitoxin [Planctomycetota bacterium]|nr:type II toxin-antitoxin system HicB family antitoxin [Planctomycetota bacterium]
MITDYIQAALARAKYKILDDGEGIFGEIRGFDGLWASAATLEACREELRTSLEAWLLVKLRHNDDDLPIVKGMNLNLKGRKKSRVA